MTPSIDQRLASMIRAMSEIILPELQNTKGLAKEQASLVLGHLMVIRAQVDFALRYEWFELLSTHLLAKRLIAIADGGSRTIEARDILSDIVSRYPKPIANSPGEVRSTLESLSAGIEDLILASGHDGHQAFLAESEGLVLEFGRTKSLRDRIFFQGMRFEGAGSQLPTIEVMMQEFEASLGGA